MRSSVLIAFALLPLLGCGLNAPSVPERTELADEIGYSAAMKRVDIRQNGYTLFGFKRVNAPNLPLHVYIEGDGFAWQQRHRPSNDPTPLNPVGLRLAAEDLHPNVVYLARPCQYLRAQSPACSSVKWTHHRFSVELIGVMNGAINQIIQSDALPAVRLYGYSGGGAMAVLVASERSDVREVRTVAANLDTALWVKHHGVSPMQGSLNPANIAAKLSSVPQLHIAGSADEVVPPKVVKSYASAGNEQGCANTHIVQGYGHYAAWQNAWPRLLRMTNEC